MHRTIRLRATSALFIFAISTQAWAITDYSDTPVAGTGTAFTSAPTLTENNMQTDGGWSSMVTNWGGGSAFMGTAISPQWFLTVSHVGTNSTVSQNGVTYNVVPNSGVVLNPDSTGDGFELWRINGTFSSYAPLWSDVVDGSENNLNSTIIGRGTDKGAVVNIQGNASNPGGWQDGATTGTVRWGQNMVFTASAGGITYLEFTFDAPNQGDNVASLANNGGNEGMVTVGDSGGGLFVYSTATNQWKLAGVLDGIVGTDTYATQSNFSDAHEDALYNTVGLYTAANSQVTSGSTRYVSHPIGAPTPVYSVGMTGAALDTNSQLGAINAGLLFLNTTPYTISGSSALTFNSTGGTTILPVVSGSNTIGTPITFTSNFTFTVPAGSTLKLSGNDNATGQALGSNGPGLLQMKNIRAGSMTISNGTVQVLSNGTDTATSILGSLSISSGGQLDLKNNDLIINSTSGNQTSTVRNYLVNSYDAGKWDLPGGIGTSAVAASNPTTTLGYADNSLLGLSNFDSQSVNGSSVLVKYTYLGDANLDGVVDSKDYAMITPGGSSWMQGDFNYDGVVNQDDYALYMYGLAAQGSPIHQVPEPVSSVILVASFIFGSLHRGRRR